MKEDFDGQLGEEYDLFAKLFPYHDEMEVIVGDETGKFARHNSSKINVLEIGCGTGITTSKLLESNGNVHVTAIYISDTMVRQVREKLEKYIHEGRLNVVKSDALEFLELNKGSFDAIASVFTIHNMHRSYRSELLRAMYNSLRNGGMFITGDKIAQDDDAEHSSHLERELGELSSFRRYDRHDIEKEWIEHYQRDNSPDYILREGRYIKSLTESGLNDVSVIFRNRMDAVIRGYKNGS